MTRYSQFIPIVICTLLLTIFAGCVGNGSTDELEISNTDQNQKTPTPTPDKPAPAPKTTTETGAINGQVVDDSFEPIPGGTVRLTNNTGTVTETFTDKEGKYTINDIKPGEYGLRFTAECCEEHLERIRIQADRTTTTSPILVAWGGHEPYVHPEKWSGFICAAGPIPEMSYCSAVDENHAMTNRFDIHRGIKTMVVALNTDDGFNLNDCLSLRLRIYPFQEPGTDTGWIWSSESCQSLPIEFRLDAGEMDPDRDFQNFTVQDINMQFQVRAERGIPSTNVVYQQTFTVYWEEHYWDYAPEGASALPDQ